MYYFFKIGFIPIAFFLVLSCRTTQPKDSQDIITVRLTREPDQLNPILSSTAVAATVQNLIFLSLMDYDPYTQRYIPVLAEKQSEIIKKGNNIGYKIKILNQAQWDDGSAVTARDVEFTLKATLNPFINSNGKRDVIAPIDSIELLKDPKELIFWTDDNYFLDEQSFTNNFIMQESKYDSAHLLNSLTWTELKNMSVKDTVSAHAKIAMTFASQFSDPKYGREQTSGNGPYQFDQWVTNQYIKLKRKQNWWGNTYKDSIVNFANYPDEIVYRIIPEEANAITALKEGLLDVIATDISPAMFNSLQEDSSIKSKINFITGPPIRYVYLAINTKSLLLDDKRTRQAVAHLLDLDQLKQNLFKGYAQRIIAPFQPAKSYYANDLKPITFNIAEAQNLLTESGWKDTNHNGIVDKPILNKIKDLKLRLFVTPGGLSQQVGIHLQEQARKAGIEIELITKPIQLILHQLQNHDFELAALSDSQYPGPDDPYGFWHSASYVIGGQNYTGFGSPLTDSIIDKIRHGESGATRDSLYHQLQSAIYDAQPAIFLFAPQNLIAVNKKWSAKAASVRPGYFVNDFRRK